MSDFTEAFDDLISAQAEVLGISQTATIGATNGVSCVIEAVPDDDVFRDGTMANAGSFRLLVKASALPSLPAKYTAVTFTTPSGNTQSLSVLSVTDNNGIFHIEVGDANE